MAQICDYFRAANAEAASLAIASGPRDCGFDTVEANSIAPDIVLGKLVALVRGAPWSPATAPMRPLWPPPQSEPSYKVYHALPEDSPLRNGPWLLELSAGIRDELASVDKARLPKLAAQWAAIEEMSRRWNADSLTELIEELVDLATTARDADDRLYCWGTI
jgi:hypothetical protein